LKKSYILAAFVAGCLTIGMVATVESNPGGAPGNVTSAPGETNCTNCHNGTPNSGNATIVLAVAKNGNAVADYMPDSMYTVSLIVGQASAAKFGFAMKADKGTLSASTDGSSQKKLNSYITHTLSGNVPQTQTPLPGRAWTMPWKAPSAGAGQATIYTSILCANGNGNEFGDNTYTRSKSLPEHIIGAGIEAPAFSKAMVRVVPGSGINITLPAGLENATVTLTDINGRVWATHQASGNQLELATAGAPTGIYLVTLSLNSQSHTSKVLLY